MNISRFKINSSVVIVYFCAIFFKVSTSDNVPEEITELFNRQNQSTTVVEAAGPPGSMNNTIYAEGFSSAVKLNISKPKLISSKESNKSENIHASNKERNSTHFNNTEALLKLDKTILDLSLSSIDEMAHGTSSIKPRKGVSYSKVVPKKGVNFEDYLNYSLPTNHSCFFLNKSSCYDVDYYYSSLSCNCCNKSNDLGELIARQPLTNCSTCLPVNDVNVEFCSGICCKNVTAQRDIGKHDSGVTGDVHKLLNVSVTYEKHVQKKKPVVTNVPYDSDITNAFNKSKGEKYIPIVVSIFILPLVGVLIFFLWKKTQELWDRRYYKRMDFLIDGMYNE